MIILKMLLNRIQNLQMRNSQQLHLNSKLSTVMIVTNNLANLVATLIHIANKPARSSNS